MSLQLIVQQSDEEIQRHKDYSKAAPHKCPYCNIKKMMSVYEIIDHEDVCMGNKRK